MGMTVKVFRDCRRRLASALAVESPSGIRERSGLAVGRISNPGERCTLGEAAPVGDSAPAARRGSGERGTLGLGDDSPEDSLSLCLAGRGD